MAPGFHARTSPPPDGGVSTAARLTHEVRYDSRTVFISGVMCVCLIHVPTAVAVPVQEPDASPAPVRMANPPSRFGCP